jgi:hypothetical protein
MSTKKKPDQSAAIANLQADLQRANLTIGLLRLQRNENATAFLDKALDVEKTARELVTAKTQLATLNDLLSLPEVAAAVESARAKAKQAAPSASSGQDGKSEHA